MKTDDLPSKGQRSSVLPFLYSEVLRSKISTTKVSSKSRMLPKVFTERGLSLELNFIIGKIKHTVKRTKKT